MRQEMQRSRGLTADQLGLVREDYERRYDGHVTVIDWDETLAVVTLANAGPGPVVEVGIRLRVIDAARQPAEERCYVGTSGAIPVGANAMVSLSQELDPTGDFPQSEGHRLTVEVVATTALGARMSPKVLRPAIRD